MLGIFAKKQGRKISNEFDSLELLWSFFGAYLCKGNRSVLIVSNCPRQLATHGLDLFLFRGFVLFVQFSCKFYSDSLEVWCCYLPIDLES